MKQNKKLWTRSWHGVRGIISQSQETGGGAPVGAAPSQGEPQGRAISKAQTCTAVFRQQGRLILTQLATKHKRLQQILIEGLETETKETFCFCGEEWYIPLPPPPAAAEQKPFQPGEFPLCPGNPAPPFPLEDSEWKKGRALAPSSGH